MRNNLLTSLFSALPLLCHGQNTILQSTIPARHTLTGERNGPVNMTFSGPIANPAAIRVNGNQIQGLAAGMLSGTGTRQITFQPAQPFAPGEQISVTVPASISSPAQVVEFRAAAARAQATFSYPNTVGSGLNTQPAVVVAGDLDNDGDIDLLIGEATAGLVCLNNGVGVFTPQTGLVDIISRADELRLADFNGDGNLDVLASSSRDNTEVSLSLGTGQGTFLPRIAVMTSKRFPTQLATGDFNGDGFMDAALSELVGSGAELRMLWGSRISPFQAGPAQVVALPARDIGAADMDEDGDIDLVLLSDVLLGVYLNDGSGKFSSGQTTDVYSSTSLNLSGSLTVGDFTGDGHADVVCSSSDVSVMSLVPGTGAGGLQSKRSVYALTRTGQVSSGDMDGDGDLDLLVTNNRGITQILLNQGDGEFATASATLIGYELFNMAEAADLNGDGMLDVYTAHGVSNPWMPHGIDMFFNTRLPITHTAKPAVLNRLTVFPVPAREQISITIPRSEQPVVLEMHDSVGRLVRTLTVSGTTSNQQVSIALNYLTAGVYVMRAQTASWYGVQRIIVE